MIRKGSHVQWKNNANNQESGKVSKTLLGRHHLNVSGIPVLRHGETDNKILIIEKENGLRKVMMEDDIIAKKNK